MINRPIAVILTTLSALSVYASDPDSTAMVAAHSIIDFRTNVSGIVSLPYVSPVVNQWRMGSSLTEVGGGYGYRNDSHIVDARLGDGETGFDLGAMTYTKHRSSTLWGHGRYTNSTINNVVWNESADADLLYPYLTADSIGGDINRETYSFGAGYADHTDRWAWGASLSYLAKLEYRSVDPRPRNVAGTLDLAIGGAYRIANNYFAGGSLYWRRYKQSNDIVFKSEMGVAKIFHLTGLGSHYYRFAGTGLSSSYSGNRYAVSADIYPASGKGLYASAHFSRFTFQKLLVDLNKLPMARAWHNSFEAEAGWLSDSWGITADVAVYRRHGIENVFGDATSGQYPLIDSNEMFADNSVAAGIAGRYIASLTPSSCITFSLHTDWAHRTMAYIQPYSYTEVSSASVYVSSRYNAVVAGRWIVGFEAGFKVDAPFDCSINLDDSNDTEVDGLIAVERAVYEYYSHLRLSPRCSASVSRSVFDKYFISLGLSWRLTRSTTLDIDTNAFATKLALLF